TRLSTVGRRPRVATRRRSRVMAADPPQLVADTLNQLLSDTGFDMKPFAGLPLRATTRRLITDANGPGRQVIARRALLEDLFTDSITPWVEPPATHGVEFRPAPAVPGAPPPEPVRAPWRVY